MDSESLEDAGGSTTKQRAKQVLPLLDLSAALGDSANLPIADATFNLQHPCRYVQTKLLSTILLCP